MAQLTVLISSTDTDFRAHVTKCLRASGTSVALVASASDCHSASLAIADVAGREKRHHLAAPRVASDGPDLCYCLFRASRAYSAAMRGEPTISYMALDYIHGGYSQGARTK